MSGTEDDFRSIRVGEDEWLALASPDARRFVLQQVTELGYVWDPARQSHGWIGPKSGALAGLATTWAPISEVVEAGEASVPDVSPLSLAQKSALMAQLLADGISAHDGAPPAPPGDARVVEALSPGRRFTDGARVREVVEDAGEWVLVRDPESDWSGRMKRATLDGWEAL